MSGHPVTPEEFEALMAQLEPLSADHRPGIARMIFKALRPCPMCGVLVRRCDRRVMIDVDDDDELLAHLDCVHDDAGSGLREGGGQEVTGDG